jgi:hypothetical protein
MKKCLGIIALVCLTMLMLCARDKPSENEESLHRNYTSLYVETYAGAQRNELTALYELLFSKDERLPLASDIEMDVLNIDELKCVISFRLANESDKDVWDTMLDETKRYLSVVAALYPLQDGGVDVYFGNHVVSENFSIAKLMEELSEDCTYYTQNQECLKQLVQELNFDLEEDAITKLWTMSQATHLQYRETLKLLNSDEAAYDIPLYSCFFDENVETGRYQALAYVLKDEELNTGKKTDEEYEKTAEILMTQYPQIEQITFRIMNETEKNNYETEKVLVFVSPWQ